MKIINRISWLVVGCLFIFSGLIKLNDPMGTAIKLEEYFEVFSTDFSSVFHLLVPYALFLSIFLSALEVVLGVALLLRWRLKGVLYTLLALTLFFTFLTFYSAYFNKVTDCGCFGDFIRLTPWQSFTKDVVLLVLILVLIVTLRYLQPYKNVSHRLAGRWVVISAIVAVAIGVFAYRNEPYFDFRAYKVGNNIPALMKPSAPLRYKYIMEKDGKKTEFETYPTDTTYVFKEMVPLNPEAGPKITDFSVWNDEGDYTQQIFEGNKLLIIIHKTEKANKSDMKDINLLVAKAESAGVQPVVLTSSSSQDFELFRHEVNLAAPYYFADHTVLKTMIRSNPGLILLQNGVVKGKWHHNNTPDIATVQQLL